MKTVKFRDYLVPLVLSGEKNSTWRLFDDKNLSAGDEIDLKEFGKEQSFGRAKITRVIEKPFKDLSEEDRQGHETFSSDKEMYERYSGYYNTEVGPDSVVKIIWFELLKDAEQS
jgi:hypothetical protein